jgi:hypothetical protein
MVTITSQLLSDSRTVFLHGQDEALTPSFARFSHPRQGCHKAALFNCSDGDADASGARQYWTVRTIGVGRHFLYRLKAVLVLGVAPWEEDHPFSLWPKQNIDTQRGLDSRTNTTLRMSETELFSMESPSRPREL